MKLEGKLMFNKDTSIQIGNTCKFILGLAERLEEN